MNLLPLPLRALGFLGEPDGAGRYAVRCREPEEPEGYSPIHEDRNRGRDRGPPR